MNNAMIGVIHFHSGDNRFCGSTETNRRITFEANDVTCPACKEKDVFFLSPEAQAYVAELESERER